MEQEYTINDPLLRRIFQKPDNHGRKSPIPATDPYVSSFSNYASELAALQKQNAILHQTIRLNEGLRQRFEELYDLAPEGFITIDAEDRIAEANLTFCQQLGIDRLQLIGQHINNFISKASHSDLTRHLTKLRQSCRPDSCKLSMIDGQKRSYEVILDSKPTIKTFPTPYITIHSCVRIIDTEAISPQTLIEQETINFLLQTEVSQHKQTEDKLQQLQARVTNIEKEKNALKLHLNTQTDKHKQAENKILNLEASAEKSKQHATSQQQKIETQLNQFKGRTTKSATEKKSIEIQLQKETIQHKKTTDKLNQSQHRATKTETEKQAIKILLQSETGQHKKTIQELNQLQTHMAAIKTAKQPIKKRPQNEVDQRKESTDKRIQPHTSEKQTLKQRLQKEINQHKNTLTKLNQLQVRTAKVIRLSIAGQMTSSIAHEITPPLTAITSYAQSAINLLRTSGGQLSKQKISRIENTLNKVVRQGQRAAKIVRNLRNYITHVKSHRETTDLTLVIRNALSIALNEILKNDIKLDINQDRSTPAIKADSVQIEQVILNLVHNAIEAMAGVPPGQRHLLIELRSKNDQFLEILVRDSGVGFKKDDRDKISTPFFSTKEKGLGMGLTISRTIIENHGGKMRIKTHKNGGTTFSFTLAVKGS